MPVRLRYRGYDVAMPDGEFVIGRGTECQLCLSDPIVSRKHAIIHATPGFVVVEDLGSRNGVIVNGEKIDKKRVLADGDVIVIGGQELTFHVDAAGADRRTQPWRAPTTGDRLASFDPDEPARSPASTTVAQSVVDAKDPLGSYGKVWQVSLLALQSGRVSEAERVLERPLAEVLSRSRCGIDVGSDLVDAAARGAARLAEATKNGYWIDYVFDLYTVRGDALPDDIIDSLEPLAGATSEIDRRTIQIYVAARKKAAVTQITSEAVSAASYAKIESLARLFGAA